MEIPETMRDPLVQAAAGSYGVGALFLSFLIPQLPLFIFAPLSVSGMAALAVMVAGLAAEFRSGAERAAKADAGGGSKRKTDYLLLFVCALGVASGGGLAVWGAQIVGRNLVVGVFVAVSGFALAASLLSAYVVERRWSGAPPKPQP